MLRQFFTAHPDGRNNSTLAVCLAIIGLLALASLVAVNVAVGKRNQGNGEKALSRLWGTVFVGNFAYETQHESTQSSHWFQVENNHAFDVRFNYEFQHDLLEIVARNEDGEVVRTRRTGRRSTQARPFRVRANETVYLDGVQGVSCRGLDPGPYRIDAYTALRFHAPEVFAVEVEDTWEFMIRAD